MNQGIFIGLIYNAALLLALGLIFDSITHSSFRRTLPGKILTGVSLGCVTLAIMINPWVLQSGIVFDTRSIVLSISAMFFGILPVLIATLMALVFRIWQGGAGVYMGCSVIATSVMWGFVWKKYHHKWHRPYGFGELYSLGIVNHLTMLTWTILVPQNLKFAVFSTIVLPVIIIYPLATVLLGQILGNRIKRSQEKYTLKVSEEQFRNLFDNAPMAYQSLDEQGRFVAVNKTWLNILGYENEEVIGRDFVEFLRPDYRDHFTLNFSRFKANGHIEDVELHLLKKDGSSILVSFNGKIVSNIDGSFVQTQCVFKDITEQRKQEKALRSIEWMLSKQHVEMESMSSYGDLTELNTNRLILDSVGKEVLNELVRDYLSLLDTSSAIYEKNGDYAIGIFSSSWCQYLDSSSRKLCNTEDNALALSWGKWLCHESCWTDVSSKAIETGKVVDLECKGGIFLYAVPIITNIGVIGAINLGYGTPPSDEETLQKISDMYGVTLLELKKKAAQYQVRPPFIIEQAKQKVHLAAKIIGEIVERRQAELILAESEEKYRSLVESSASAIIMVDTDGIISFVNHVAAEAFHLSESEITGKYMHDLFPPEMAKYQMQQVHNVLQTGESKIEELCTVILGKDTWYHTSVFPVFNAAGKPYLAIVNATDISHIKEAELALRESQSIFKQFIDFIPGGVFISDKNSKALYVNKHITDVFGETGGVGSSPRDSFPPEVAELLIAEDKMALEQGFRQTEETVPHEDGTIHTYEATKFAIKRENEDDLLGGIILDITDRKNAEAALQESQSRFEQFMNQVPGNVFIKDKNSRFLYVNEYMVRLYGADAWIGKTPIDVFPEAEAKMIIDDDQLAMDLGNKRMVDLMQDAEGTPHYYETTKFTIYLADSVALIGGLSLDITDKKLGEIEIQRYTRRLEILHEIDSIVLENLSFETVAKSVLENLYKLVPCSLLTINEIDGVFSTIRAIHKDAEDISFLEQNKQNPITPDFIRTITEKQLIVIDDVSAIDPTDKLYIRDKLIEEGMLSFMYAAMLVGNDLLGFIAFSSKTKNFFNEANRVVLIDIANHLSMVLQQIRLTEAVKRHSEDLEMRVEERTEQLHLANKELDAFSYTVAHDLRSPLRSIDGFSNILLEDFSPSLDHEAINIIHTIIANTRKMDTLIKELLELARLNPYTMKFNVVNMRDLLTKVLEDTLSDEERHTFNIQIGDLPQVYADSTLIRQVWQNLLANAVKFTLPQKEHNIVIGSYLQDNGFVFFIKDSGVGFDMKYVSKIFDHFQRLHKESEFEGTGIGLAIVKKIIQRHNGEVWAESELGKGSTFYFTLPDQAPTQ